MVMLPGLCKCGQYYACAPRLARFIQDRDLPSLVAAADTHQIAGLKSFYCVRLGLTTMRDCKTSLTTHCYVTLHKSEYMTGLYVSLYASW